MWIYTKKDKNLGTMGLEEVELERNLWTGPFRETLIYIKIWVSEADKVSQNRIKNCYSGQFETKIYIKKLISEADVKPSFTLEKGVAEPDRKMLNLPD